MKVEVKEDGRTLVYEGVLVGEILKRTGVPLGTGAPRQRHRHLRRGQRDGRLSGRVLARKNSIRAL